MGLTLTLEEAKGRTAYDLIQEAAQAQQPLIVMLENGTAVSIQQYAPDNDAPSERPVLEPLPQFSVGVPDGWKDADLYDGVNALAEGRRRQAAAYAAEEQNNITLILSRAGGTLASALPSEGVHSLVTRMQTECKSRKTAATAQLRY